MEARNATVEIGWNERLIIIIQAVDCNRCARASLKLALIQYLLSSRITTHWYWHFFGGDVKVSARSTTVDGEQISTIFDTTISSLNYNYSRSRNFLTAVQIAVKIVLFKADYYSNRIPNEEPSPYARRYFILHLVLRGHLPQSDFSRYQSPLVYDARDDDSLVLSEATCRIFASFTWTGWLRESTGEKNFLRRNRRCLPIQLGRSIISSRANVHITRL